MMKNAVVLDRKWHASERLTEHLVSVPLGQDD